MIAPEEEEPSFNIYPNPVSTVLTIETELEGTIIISNNLGQIIGEYTIEQFESFELDVSDFANGIYYCKFVGASNKVIATEQLEIIH